MAGLYRLVEPEIVLDEARVQLVPGHERALALDLEHQPIVFKFGQSLAYDGAAHGVPGAELRLGGSRLPSAPLSSRSFSSIRLSCR